MQIFRSNGTPLISFLVFLILATSAWATDQKATDTVATVNGQPISRQALDVTTKAVSQQFSNVGWDEADPDQLLKLQNMALDRLVDFELMYQASEKEGVKVEKNVVEENMAEFKKKFPSDVEFNKFLEFNMMTDDEFKMQFERKMFIQDLQKILRERFIAQVTVPDVDVRKFYDDNQDKFVKPEQVKASHILVTVAEDADEATQKAAKEKIEDLQKQVNAGTDFAELAKGNSDCPSKEQGGDLGFFGRKQMVQPFEEAAFSTETGKVSDIVKTRFGYHLIKVADKKAEETVPFDEVKQKISDFLSQKELDAKFASYLEEIRTKADIKKMIPAVEGS